MKKLIVGLFATVLLTGVLVVTTSGTANAACQVYSGCVDTVTTAYGLGTVKRKKRAIVCGKTVVRNSNAKPVGKLRFTIERNRGKYRYSKTVDYRGGKVCLKTQKLRKKGGYTLVVHFLPRPKSVFNPSAGGVRFAVGR